MRSFTFAILALAFLAASSHAWPSTNYPWPTLEIREHGNANNTEPTSPQQALQKICRKMRRLNALSQLSANQTRLDTWVAEGKLNMAEVEALNERAASATAELEILQSNTTLVSECTVVNAERKSIKQCKKMKRLTKLVALARNETALTAFEQKKGLNETGIERLKTKIAEAVTKLQEMHSNTTLTEFCAQRQQQKADVSDSGDTAAGQVQQTASTASGLTAKSMPFLVVPALAAVFTLLL